MASQLKRESSRSKHTLKPMGSNISCWQDSAYLGNDGNYRWSSPSLSHSSTLHGSFRKIQKALQREYQESQSGIVLKVSQRPTDRSRGSDGEWLHDMHDNKNAAPAKPTLQQQTTNNRVIVTNLHYELSAKDLTVRPLATPLSAYRPTTCCPQSVFGQVGTLVREPLIRVRKLECPQFT